MRFACWGAMATAIWTKCDLSCGFISFLLRGLAGHTLVTPCLARLSQIRPRSLSVHPWVRRCATQALTWAAGMTRSSALHSIRSGQRLSTIGTPGRGSGEIAMGPVPSPTAARSEREQGLRLGRVGSAAEGLLARTSGGWRGAKDRQVSSTKRILVYHRSRAIGASVV